MADLNYTADSISKLSDKEAMRTRGTMYFGSYDIDAVYHMTFEAIANSIDERTSGFGTKCIITIYEDNSIEISDDARGIPVGKNKDGDEALEVAFSVIHGGGKLGKDDQEAYNSSGGLNGVGLKIITYTSKFCIGTVKRDGEIHQIRFEDGNKIHDTKVIGKSKDTGTTIHFLPDVELFKDINVDSDTIYKKLKELSYLTKGYIFELTDKRSDKYNKTIIKSDNGLLDYATEIVGEDKPLCKPIYVNERDDTIGCEVEFVLQYIDDDSTYMKLYTNNIPNTGGMHFTGFSTALTSSINAYARSAGLLKEKDTNFTGSDLQEGMILIMNVRIPEPQFDSQVKSVLKDARGRTIAQKATTEHIKYWLSKNVKEAKAIINKILSTQKALKAMKAAKDRSLKTGNSRRGVKKEVGDAYKPCLSEDPAKRELFLCEGNSAATTVAKSRNANTQSILALRGKLMNTEKETDLEKMLDPKKKGKIKEIVQVIGAGLGAEFDIKKTRYHKIILATDQDDDGFHIQILLTTFFWKYMRPLIEKGMVYIAQSPLYVVERGKNTEYYFSEREMAGVDTTGCTVYRNKGLGELEAHIYKKTSVDPTTRTLKRITVENAKLAEQRFTELMGVSVPPRKQFIEENAYKAHLEN